MMTSGLSFSHSHAAVTANLSATKKNAKMTTTKEGCSCVSTKKKPFEMVSAALPTEAAAAAACRQDIHKRKGAEGGGEGEFGIDLAIHPRRAAAAVWPRAAGPAAAASTTATAVLMRSPTTEGGAAEWRGEHSLWLDRREHTGRAAARAA